ncbi:MAG: MlaE family ABC transporter permease [Pseudobdellovibrionaceae bacterium]
MSRIALRYFNLSWSYVDDLGRRFLGTCAYVAEVLFMVYLSFRAAVVDHSQGMRSIVSVVATQIYFTGWQAMPLISMLSIASGAVVILQSSAQLSLLGGTEMIGNLLVVIIVRELGPLMTALVVIARSGTAVASEIGNMGANREIEAMESMGIHPLSYIVFPRIMGGVISVVCLAFFFNVIAIFGGYAITRLLHDMPFVFYTDMLVRALAAEDLILFLVKNIFSGIIIFVVCSHQGLQVKKSPTEVPQVTTKAVVNSVIFVTVFNLAVTALFYLNQLMKLGVI